MDLRLIFLLIWDGFWEGLGGQVGPKIHRKSLKNRYGKVIEFLIEKWGVRCKQPLARRLGWGPLKSINPGVQGDTPASNPGHPQGHCTLHFVPQGHGGGYIVKYF